MAEIEKTEFEFPDEKEENARKGGRVVEPEQEIEVVDDTPETDRYRTPMAEAPQDPTEEELALFSNEEQVNAQTPKAFIVHASDDNAVPLKNSLLYAERLTANKVPVDLHVYAKGGHGFGLNNKTTSGDLWFDRLITWMKANQLL